MNKRGRELKKYIKIDGVRGGLSSSINLFHSASLLSVLKMKGESHISQLTENTHIHTGGHDGVLGLTFY